MSCLHLPGDWLWLWLKGLPLPLMPNETPFCSSTGAVLTVVLTQRQQLGRAHALLSCYGPCTFAAVTKLLL